MKFLNNIKPVTLLVLVSLVISWVNSYGQEQDNFPNLDVIVNNETNINTKHYEYSPAFYEDGIVFISSQIATKRYKIRDKRLGDNIMSIFYSRRGKDGLLKKPELFAQELLSTVHEGPLTLDRTNDRIFFTRNNLKNGKRVKAKDGEVKLKIYVAEKISGNAWGNIEELPFNDDQSNTAHPSVSVEGDMLFFSSDRPGGYGGKDIYVSFNEGGIWGVPVNLGPDINTAGEEVFPYMHADGTLYFSSNGHGGKGGLDIFLTYQDGPEWAIPINFEMLNTDQDDFGLILDRDKKNGYLSSNGRGGYGEDDIFNFRIIGDLDELTRKEKEIAKEMKIVVTDMTSGEPIEGAMVQNMELDEFTMAKAIIANKEGEPETTENLLLSVPFDETSEIGSTNANGEYSVWLNPGNYIFKTSKSDYQTKRIVVNTNDSDDGIIYITLNQRSLTATGEDEVFEAPAFLIDENGQIPSTIEEGTVFRLPNIYYNFNDASIRPDARVDLDYLTEFLKRYPEIEIELSSHTDARGSREYNQRLSQRRAENVVAYLIGKGVKRRRMEAVGYGESRLRNDCADGVRCSEEEHQFNRRTEVKITRMTGTINLKVVSEDSDPTYVNPMPDAGNQDVAIDYTFNNQSPSNRYSVVAGAFRQASNAQHRVVELINLGYANASIDFSSGLHKVVVGAYKTKKDAKEVVDELDSIHGIDSYVKKL